jgi:hypothetical protein
MDLDTSYYDAVPGEQFFVNCLQKPIALSVKNKNIKRGRLLLFRRAHYYIQLSLETLKNSRENIDIPIPFNVECYEREGLMYFDYRVSSLNVGSLPKIPEKLNSVYLNNILEIQVD